MKPRQEYEDDEEEYYYDYEDDDDTKGYDQIALKYSKKPLSSKDHSIYRVSHVVADLGWVGWQVATVTAQN